MYQCKVKENISCYKMPLVKLKVTQINGTLLNYLILDVLKYEKEFSGNK